MRFYLYSIFICYFYQVPNLAGIKENILNFGYSIKYKYEGMLAHSFDRFYMVTKFILPSIGDFNFSTLNYDNTCAYLDNNNVHDTNPKEHMLDVMTFCKKIEPFMLYYKILIKSYNNTDHNILENEINLILHQIPRKQKCGIITMLVSSFIGLAYEGISSFLHHKQKKVLHKAVRAMDSKATIQHNKLMQLENSMLMYGVYNSETLEKLINTVFHIHNTTFSRERLFAGQQSSLTLRSLYANLLGLHHYSINSLLYLRTVQGKYIALYRELITHLHIYATSIRILAKGYLPISLVTPSKLRAILNDIKTAIRKTNPDYDLVIDRLHLYYDMQLATFGINKDKNLIIQFLVFIQPYIQQPLILYQLETVPVPIVDQNTQAQSYTHLQVNKPYIALKSETYMSIRHQELRTCKRIGYAFYCEKLFIVKHKPRYSCESMIYFNLDAETIKENCKFKFYYNKTDVTPTVLDGGNEIILANWPNDKHIIYNINNNIPIKIPSHPYVLVNRSVLCNCGIEVGNHFLLEPLAACQDINSKLTMYFTVNTAFVNYVDKFPNLTVS